MSMGSPNINIIFKKAAETTARTGNQETVGLILLEESVPEAKTYTIYGAADIPAGITAANAAHIKRALVGADYAPRAVVAYVGTELAAGLAAMKAQEIDWLAGPETCTAENAAAIEAWIKAQWTDGAYVCAVLPKIAGAHPGIVNLAEESFSVADGTLTPAQMAARVAGMICGTAGGKSITYAKLDEISGVAAKTKAERDTAVDAGKLIAWQNGKSVRLDRGVTSLVTATAEYPEELKKIRYVDTLCRIRKDIRAKIEENYIGQYSNTYLNKCVLVGAINDYLQTLATLGMIETGSTAEIDTEAQRAWLIQNGKDVSGMTDGQINAANTGSAVFIECGISLIDAIEDITIKIEY